MRKLLVAGFVFFSASTPHNAPTIDKKPGIATCLIEGINNTVASVCNNASGKKIVVSENKIIFVPAKDNQGEIQVARIEIPLAKQVGERGKIIKAAIDLDGEVVYLLTEHGWLFRYAANEQTPLRIADKKLDIGSGTTLTSINHQGNYELIGIKSANGEYSVKYDKTEQAFFFTRSSES